MMNKIEINIPDESEIISVKDRKELPQMPGIYKFYNNEKLLLYIGKTENLRDRVSGHLGNSKTGHLRHLKHNFKYVNYILIDCPMNRDIIETFLINKECPKLNEGKTFLYKSEYYSDFYKTEEYLKRREIYDKERNKKISEVFLDLNL